MTFGMTLAEHFTMAASADMFYFAIDYEKELQNTSRWLLLLICFISQLTMKMN